MVIRKIFTNFVTNLSDIINYQTTDRGRFEQLYQAVQ